MRMSSLAAPRSKNEQADPQSDRVREMMVALPTTASTARNDSVPLPPTREVIRKFDRDTGWVATAVLAMVIFGAIVLAMQIKESHLEGAIFDKTPFSNRAHRWTIHRPDNFGPAP
jgi:hypothetical protein